MTLPGLSGWPFTGLDFDRTRLRDELARMGRGQGAFSGLPVGVFPAVNIYDDGESFLVRAELPGIDKEGLEITAQGDQLTIRGERKLQQADAPASYHRREREFGRFRRVITLPQRVDSGRVQATYRNGVLEIVLPRVAEAQARRVQIS